MPFSAENPNRNRNYIIAMLAVVTVFVIVMVGYVTLTLADKDTDSYVRFLTIIVSLLIPGLISAWNSYQAKRHSETAVTRVEGISAQLDGTLDARLRQANRDTQKEVRDG